MEQRSPQWFEARKNRVTASMVGAILGLSPYMTRASAMRTMVRTREGADSEFTGNVATEWGVANEDGACFDYEMETTHTVQKIGFVPFEDWAGVSPDGLIGEDGGVEFKCPFGLRHDPAPVFKTLAEQPHYEAQVQFSMFVTGRSWWHFYQWTPNGTKLEMVERDDEWINVNIPRLRQFHSEFLEEPAEDHIGDARVIIDTPEAARMVREWDELAEQAERVTERKADLLAQMVEAAKERNAILAGRKLTLTKRAGSVSYAKAIKELAPNADLEKWRGKPSESWGLR